MTPTRWLAVIALAVTLTSFSLARWRMQNSDPGSLAISRIDGHTVSGSIDGPHSVPRPQVSNQRINPSRDAAAIVIDRIQVEPEPTIQIGRPAACTEIHVSYPVGDRWSQQADKIGPDPGEPIDPSLEAPRLLPALRAESNTSNYPRGRSDREVVSSPRNRPDNPPITIGSDSERTRVDAATRPPPHPAEAIKPLRANDEVVEFVAPAPSPRTPAIMPRPQSNVSEQQPGQRLWWDDMLDDPVRHGSIPKPVGVEDLIVGALRHSPKVRAISTGPLIHETTIMEAEGQFDWRAFMESRFTDTSDPVGSTLTTGGPNRLLDENWRYSGGMRRKLFSGGKLEVAQRIGLENSNSLYFTPVDQANSKLSLNFTQPLLNGAGRAYNTSLIVLAQIDTDVARDEFSKQIQEHLIQVARAYWDLYLNRAVLLQRRQVHAQSVRILEELENRRGVDSLESQIVRARAAVAVRQSDIARFEMAVRNAESRLRALVNDPDLLPNEQVELVPVDRPTGQQISISLNDSMATAMQHRPEIDQATQNVRAATVRLGVSKKELQPVLDFVAEAYASGLEGNFAVNRSYGDQFTEGRPSYSVGLVFEIPIGNREARARYQRRQLELEQVAHELQNVIESTRAEVEIAVRLVDTSYREAESKVRAVAATEEEVRYLEERWRLLPGEDQAASFVLEDLLDAQDRLADQEEELVTAQVAYSLSLFELKRVTGVLLEAEDVTVTRGNDGCKPTLILDKPSASGR